MISTETEFGSNRRLAVEGVSGWWRRFLMRLASGQAALDAQAAPLLYFEEVMRIFFPNTTIFSAIRMSGPISIMGSNLVVSAGHDA